MPDKFTTNSLPVRINDNVIMTDDDGFYISLAKSGKLEIEFQDTICNVDLPANEIVTKNIIASPVGVIVNNYLSDKLPASATINDEDITDIRFFENSIWLPQCYRKKGTLKINHNNEFTVPFKSSALYKLNETIKLQEFSRQYPSKSKIIIDNFKQNSGDKLSFRYKQDVDNWYTAIINSQKIVDNLPQTDFYIINFNKNNNIISERINVDLNHQDKHISFNNLILKNNNRRMQSYQDTNGYYQSKIISQYVNRAISGDILLSDNKLINAPIEKNTTFIMECTDFEYQFTRFKWFVHEDNSWRLTESEWMNRDGNKPTATIHNLKSGSKVDFIAYTTTTYVPKIWFANDLVIPYPDYDANIKMPVKFTELPVLKGKLTRKNDAIPSTSGLYIIPIKITPILKNITPKMEQELRINKINFDISTGDFNIILPGYGKYRLEFYTYDDSFPADNLIIEQNINSKPVKFILKQ